MTTFTSEDRERAMGEEQEKKRWNEVRKVVDEMKDEEYTGGIPIPFMGWAQINEEIDREEREKMLREQLHTVNQQLQEANQLISDQRKVLELYQEFVKEKNLLHLWMYFMGDRKDV